MIKTITTMPEDAGDTIVYDVVIQHTAASSAGAMDVNFSDLLPPEIDAVSVTAVDSSNSAVVGFVIVPGGPQDEISNPDFNLALNETITLTITGTVNTSVVAGDTIVNTAEITWATLDDDAAEDGFDNNPDPADNIEGTGDDESEAEFTAANPTFDKSILSTGINDASNDDGEVVAGEYVTYQLVVTVPEGTTKLAEITDVLDPDLIFDPTFTVTAVGSSGVSFTGPATAPTVTGTNINFDLGTITNTDVDDAIDDTVTITYRVYADSDVVLGDVLPNDATLIWDANDDGDNLGLDDGNLDDTTSVTVIGPELEISKTITTIPSDAGDAIEYTFVINHTANSSAGAFDASFTDVIPSEISSVAIVSVLDSSNTAVPGFIVAGNTVSNPDFDLALGETLTIVVSGEVNVTASASTTVSNTANVDWDSLGDDSQGNQSEEGTGSDDASDEFVVTSPTFSKSILSTGIDDATNDNTQVVAGEYVTYELVVTVPEGTTPLAEITDTLDPDLIFDPTFSITAVGSSGVTFTGSASTPTVSGTQVNFDLGIITNTDVDDAVPDTVTITYRVYADSDVVLGDVLPNDATLIWDADNDGDNSDPEDRSLDDGTTVTVIGPELIVEKNVTLVPSDVGDPITYEIVIRHSAASYAPVSLSQTTAYDVTLSDNMPAGLTGLTIDSAVDSGNNAIAGFTLVGNNLSHAGFDLALNETITLTVSGFVGAGILEGDTITNVADITWTSLDDDSDDGNDTAETNESDSDTADFSIANIEKSIVGTGINDASNDDLEAVHGEYITYQLDVTVPQGSTPLAEIVDTLDAGLGFDVANGVTVVPSSGNVSTSLVPGDFSSVTAVYDATTNTVQFALGDVTNTAPAGTVETLTLTYRVFVNDDDVNAPVGAALNNAVEYKWDIDGDGSNSGPLDGTTEDEAPDVVIIAPELEVTKVLIDTPIDAGDTVTYEITIEHTAASQAAAFDVSFTDIVPSEISGVSIVSAVDSSAAPVAGFGVTGNTVSNPDFDLALGEKIVLTVTGTVNTTASASTTVTNTASIDWDTLGDDAQGNQDEEDTGDDSSSDEFVVASPTFDKLIVSTGIDDGTNDYLHVVAGEFIVYDLVVTLPEGTTPLAQITDTLNPNLIFDPSFNIVVTPSSGVTISGTPSAPTVSGNAVVFDLGTIVNADVDDSVADTVTITYRAYADADVVRDEVLDNSATLIWDADNDGDNTDPDDGSLTDQTSVTTLVPELIIEKAVTQVPADIGDTIEYTFVIRHTDAGDAPASVSNATAYDIVFTDNLPTGVINASVVSAIDSAGNTVAGFTATNTATASSINNASFDLAVGDEVTITVLAEMGAAVVEGDTIINTSDIQWGTLDEASDDGFDAGEATDTDSDSANFSLANVEKSIVGTGINDAFNDDTEAVAGEYIYYQVVVEVPQGSSPIAELVDVLDPGLIYDAAHGVSVTASSANLSTSLAPGDFSSVVSNYDALTNTVSIELGDVANSAALGEIETLTLNYRVYVANDNVDAATGSVQNNAVDFRWDIDGDGSNSGPLDGSTEAEAPPVTVITPELSVTKDIIQMPSETGDKITYQFTIEHTPNSDTTAYDVTFSDAIPVGITNLVIDSATTSAGGPIAGFTLTGNTLSHSSFDLLLGESIVVELTGTVTTAIDAGDTIPNTSTITWGGLDAGNPSDGADISDPNAEGMGSDDDDESFSISDIHKSIVDTSIGGAANTHGEVVPGEFITYQVIVDIPQGTTPVAEVIDTLDAGLAFDSLISVTSNSPDLTTSIGNFSDVVAPATGATGSVNFALGNITNNNADNAQTESITLTYRVVVTNSNVVTAGAQLNNGVEFIYDTDGDGQNNGPGDGSTIDQAPNVTVLEPELSVTKAVSDTVPHLGQTITYTVVVTNEGVPFGTDAMDVNVVDSLPTGMVFHPGSVTVDGQPLLSASGVASNSTGNALNLTLDQVDYDSSVTITYQATVSSDTADFGASLANQVGVNWSSLSSPNGSDGNDDEERDGSDGYVTSANESITLTAPDYEISKSSSNTAPLRAGEEFTYTIQVANVGTHEGTGVVVTDTFPVIALGQPLAISNGGTFDANTGLITWSLGQLDVNESVSLTVDVAILEDLTPDIDGDGNSLSDFFDNSVEVTDDGANGDDPNLNNNQATDTDEVIATPDYGITKTNEIEMAPPLSQFTYVIEADNHGTQAGTNVVIVDTYPTNILQVIDPDGGVVDASAGTITWTYPVMSVGDSVQLNVVMEVLPTAYLDTPDQLFYNEVSITDDGTNGPDGTPDDNTASHSDMLLAGAGEPMRLIATPESSKKSDQWLDNHSERETSDSDSLIPPTSNEQRLISAETMKAEGRSASDFADDLVRGGDLLDTYSLDNLEVSEECKVYYSRADVAPSDLLSEPETGAANPENPWGWLEDLPDVETTQIQDPQVDAADLGADELSAIDPQNDIDNTVDNGMTLPETALNEATSLFKAANSPISQTFENLPPLDSKLNS